MEEIARIKDQLQRAFAGDAWYGSSFSEALDGVSVEKAIARPLAGAHSIWEIVLHVAAWKGAIRRRLEGDPVELPAEGDWPPVTETNEAGWKRALAALEHNHNELQRVIARLTDAQLDARINGERDRATGGGVSFYVTLHGIIQHDVYHAGQIALLKKA